MQVIGQLCQDSATCFPLKPHRFHVASPEEKYTLHHDIAITVPWAPRAIVCESEHKIHTEDSSP